MQYKTTSHCRIWGDAWRKHARWQILRSQVLDQEFHRRIDNVMVGTTSVLQPAELHGVRKQQRKDEPE